MVDGTALEMRRACKGSVGSNPTLSASKKVSSPVRLANWRCYTTTDVRGFTGPRTMRATFAM